MKERVLALVSDSLWAARKRIASVHNRVLTEQRLARLASLRKLHLGCGTVRLDGWINVDAEAQPTVDLVWDLRFGVPGADATATFVFCEHLLEHLTASDGVAFLRDCRRVLKPGGTLRVAMPSLDHILSLVCSGRWNDQPWVKACKDHPIQTQAEMLNMVFRDWGHQWLYDREELARRAREAGFRRFRFLEKGASEIPELRGLETREDSLLVCELDNV